MCGLYDSQLQFHDVKVTPKRTTKSYEIEYYLSENGYSYVDDAKIPHKEGNLLFIRPNQVRYSEKSFLCYCLHIEPTAELEQIFKDMPNLIQTPSKSVFRQCFSEIIHLYNKSGNGNRLQLQSKIFELLSMLYDEGKIENKRNKAGFRGNKELLERAIHYMEDHLASAISLSDIAAEVNLSPVYFHKIFSMYTGKTPREYLLKKRLSLAMEELITRDISISRIAENCGISSQAYFSYCFARECGISPHEYRQKKYIHQI